MGVSPQFKIAAALLIAATLAAKLLIAGGVQNPTDEEIAVAVQPFFEQQGFGAAGLGTFAGRPALILGRNNCLMYAVPVAHQGWHQATVRSGVTADQELWFVFDGNLRKDRQQRWYPLAKYYFDKALGYVGINLGYPPVLALVTSGDCGIQTVAWSKLSAIPFKSIRINTLLSGT